MFRTQQSFQLSLCNMMLISISFSLNYSGGNATVTLIKIESANPRKLRVQLISSYIVILVIPSYPLCFVQRARIY